MSVHHPDPAASRPNLTASLTPPTKASNRSSDLTSPRSPEPCRRDGRTGRHHRCPKSQRSVPVIEYGSALPCAQWFLRWAVIPGQRSGAEGTGESDFSTHSRRGKGRGPDSSRRYPNDFRVTNAPPSPVESKITHWAPKQVTVHTRAGQPGVLLLKNDRWDPNWRATVDGKLVPILRANYLMRAVGVPRGGARWNSLSSADETSWVTLAVLTAALGAGAWMVLGIESLSGFNLPTSAPGSAKTRALPEVLQWSLSFSGRPMPFPCSVKRARCPAVNRLAQRPQNLPWNRQSGTCSFQHPGDIWDGTVARIVALGALGPSAGVYGCICGGKPGSHRTKVNRFRTLTMPPVALPHTRTEAIQSVTAQWREQTSDASSSATAH